MVQLMCIPGIGELHDKCAYIFQTKMSIYGGNQCLCACVCAGSGCRFVFVISLTR